MPNDLFNLEARREVVGTRPGMAGIIEWETDHCNHYWHFARLSVRGRFKEVFPAVSVLV